MKKLLVLLITMLLITSCNNNFKQVAYYKNERNNRVFVYVSPETDLTKIRKHAEKQTYTKHSLTTVYYYNKLELSTEWLATLEENSFDAQTLCFTGECIAKYIRFPTGKVLFVANPFDLINHYFIE